VTALLEARDLAYRRGGVQVLDIPCLALEAGKVLVLIGPNGAGKSTLLQALAGLLAPLGGTLTFRGETLASKARLQAYRRSVTMVFQEPLLFDTTVRGNLAAGLRLRHLDPGLREARILEQAQAFGITHLLDRSARRLSGGEAQRTALARAFALHPEILFLDEPFSALDPPTRAALLGDLGRMLRRTGTTAVLATHDLDEALLLGDRLGVLLGGHLVQLGPPSEVINHPAGPEVAAFVGMETLLEGRVLSCAAGTFRVGVGNRQVEVAGEGRPGQLVLLGLRPENVVLARRPEAGSSARNHFPARLLRVRARGPFFQVDLDCGFFLSAFVTARSLEELELREGTEMEVRFKATALHVLRSV
jgi:tungstate transport system ATP-binding protein